MSEDLLKRLHEATSDELDALLAQVARQPPAPVRASRPADGAPIAAPLSCAQERMWFLEQLEPSGAAYHMSLVLDVSGRLNTACLRDSVRVVMDRQHQLRAAFHSRDGTLVQEVASAPDPPVGLVDLSDRVATGREPLVQSIVAAAIGGAFDLARGPLFRIVLIRESTSAHRLVLVFHHAIADAWSVRVVLREIGASYRALASGQRPAFTPLPLQYADFASWQRQWLAGGVAERQLGFWRPALQGIPDHLAFPTDFLRSFAVPPHGGRVAFQLGVSVDTLRDFARHRRTTVFAVLLAAYHVLLARMTGQSCVVVGSPVAGRSWVDVEDVVGLFVNTLPLRGDVSGDPRFCDLLDRTTQTIATALAHQDVPFEYLVHDLQPVRDRNRTPVFQTMLQLADEPLLSVDLPGIECVVAPAPPAAAKFDFSLSVTAPASAAMSGVIEYDARLFHPETMAQLADAYTTLIDGIVANPERPVSELPLMTRSAHARLLEQGSGSRGATAAESLDRQFERQAKESPGAAAAIEGGRTVSYGELDVRANRLARRMIACGVRPGATVAVRLTRSAELLCAIIAIFKAGAIYLPLSSHDPPHRTRRILTDAGAALVLTNEPAIAGSELDCLAPNSDGAIDRAGDAGPPVDRSPERVAYIIYTSGSTGAPKGVCVTHANVAALVDSSRCVLGMTSDDRVLQQFAPSFDLSIFEIFVTLTSGAALVIPSDETLLAPRRLVELLDASGVTIVHGTPTHAEAMLSAERPLGRVRAVCLGGERFTTSLLARLEGRVSADCRIFNMYGPTETGILCTMHEIDRAHGASYRALASVPIGRPTAGATLYVVDVYGNILPPGAAGELLVGGAGVAIGYRSQPALTADHFVPNRFERGSRLYRSGDRVRWRHDGQLEFLGRIDEQVKIRGFRVEPGEVEALLSRHPDVREAVVIACEHAGETRLAAFIVARSPGESLVADLRRLAEDVLPAHMMPSDVVLLDRLPRTASGKIDRLALKASAPAAGSANGRADRPCTETERRLIEIWRDMLHREDIGASDNFFALGGHSLHAARITARIHDLFGCEVPLRSLFDAPTVAGLAVVIDRLRSAADRPADPAASRPWTIRRTAHDGESLPTLSCQQEDLWQQEAATGRIHPNNIQCGLRFTGALNEAALEQSIAALQRRHAALRTAFRAQDDGAVPEIADPVACNFRLARVDLSALPPRIRAEALAGVARSDQARAFDLARGPLCRATVVRLGRADRVVLFTTHHLVCDAWSINVLVSEITQLYAASLRGEAAELPALPFEYVDYARWQREQLAGPEFAAQLAYWTRQLAPPWPDLLGPGPGGEDRFDSPHFAVRRRRPLALRAETLAGARELARVAECTLFAAVMASLELALFARTRQPDVRVATLGANRSVPGCERLAGLFSNVLCLRTQVDGSATLSGFVDLVHRTILDASSRQELPFSRVAHALEAAPGAAGTLFQVAVFWQPLVLEPLQFPSLRTSLFRAPTEDSLVLVRSSSLELVFDLVETASEVGGTITYNPNRLGAEEIDHLMRDWERLVWLARDQPTLAVADACGAIDARR